MVSQRLSLDAVIGALSFGSRVEEHARMSRMARRLVAVVGFVALVWIWNVWAEPVHSGRLHLLCMFLFLMPVPVIGWLGRLVLERPRTQEQIAWTTLCVHYAVMLLMGPAIISAYKVTRVYPLVVIPVPRELGWVLVNMAAGVVPLTVITLALRGLGAPFAIALSQRLATNWLYQYTRNPMVVSLILFFIAAALWLQSLLALIWVLGALIPAELSVVKLYEERELELRFGESYRTYKRTTPMLLGKRHPAGEAVKAATASQ
jgi:protein-S-isoprenylcysteine O-methyltransferase Ste14